MKNSDKNNKSQLPVVISFFLAIAASLLILVSCANDEGQTVTTYTEIVVQDEFDVDGAPDSSLWGYDIGTGSNGWGNNELQYYTDREENVKVENGMLHITARAESFEGASYTSARILTKGKFDQVYGRFEARMKLPWGQGMWPAFWLLGADIDTNNWPCCGEIDIMENRGSEPTLVSSAVHGPGYSGGNPVFKSYDLVNERVDTDFHIYGIEWGPEYINFYVDDVLYNQITPNDLPVSSVPDWLPTDDCVREKWNEWVFDKPFFIIINLAVGGNFGGPPNENTVFPQTLTVDYVRVYRGDE